MYEHLHEVPRIGTCIETENKRLLGAEGREIKLLFVSGSVLLLRMMKF